MPPRSGREGREAGEDGDGGREQSAPDSLAVSSRTKNLDFRGFDSSIFFIPRAGIPRSAGSFPEI